MAYEKVLNNPAGFNFEIEQLGEAQFANPSSKEVFVEEGEKIIFSSHRTWGRRKAEDAPPLA